MGLRSGEYGGKNRSSQSALSANSRSVAFLWNVALSKIMTEYLGIDFNNIVSNQYSKSTLSVVLSYIIGATTLSPHFAATMFVRLNFFPLTFPQTGTPRRE
jgi:hypothetical protein